MVENFDLEPFVSKLTNKSATVKLSNEVDGMLLMSHLD